MRILVPAACVFFAATALAQPPVEAPASPDRAALKASLIATADTYLAQRASTVAALTTRQQAEARQTAVRAKILTLIGGLPTAAERGPLNAKTTGTYQAEGFHVERVLFDSLPGFHVTADLYLPDTRGPFPAVVDTPGHGPNGKLSEYNFAANMAHNGIAVLAVDPLGQGERLQYLDPVTGQSAVGHPTGEHGESGIQPALLGDHVSRYFINDGIRAIDYLQSRPEIDPKRIGAFGCSGGGTDTAYLTALDPRVRVAGAACFVTTLHELYHSPTGIQEAEQSIPGFISPSQGPILDIPDWVELAAPRLFAVLSTTEDMFPFAGATAAVAEARNFYKLFNAEPNLDWFTGPGHHGNIRPLYDKLIAFFLKNLAGSTETPVIANYKAPADKELLVTSTGQISSSIGGETVASLNRKRAATITRPHLSTTELQQKIKQIAEIPASTPPAPTSLRRSPTPSHVKIVLTDELPPQSTTAPPVNLLYVGMRPTPPGSEELKAKALGSFYLLSLQAMVVGETLPGIRIAGLRQAIDQLCADKSDKAMCKDLEVESPAKYAVVAMQAAILDPRIAIVRITGDIPTYASLIDQPITQNASESLMPGVLRAYDIPDLVNALHKRLVINQAIITPRTN